MRGRTADTPSFGEAALRPSPDLSLKELEARAREAHRIYIEALCLWEGLQVRENSRDCADDSREKGRIGCAEAEARKEERRIAFRDLCDLLGYVPADLRSGLRAEPVTDRSHICARKVAAETA